ncbi:MAG: DNA-3-methyladenine glycosylase 2 [Oscillospiraceae bacterium]|nr:DNA-3-methyladenine glycosylase 2 [Oscillospiraceae bacterium]
MEYFLETDFIDLDSTFNCGQCFRWENGGDGLYSGTAGNKSVTVRQEKKGMTLLNVEKADIAFWEEYFCVDEDYSAIIEKFRADSTLREACGFAPGLRLLRQEPFETLISFIISQNNNIKRIKGIINKMCSVFGENGAIPAPETLARLEVGDLTPLGTGYRARYIIDAAKKIVSGEIMLDEIAKMPYNGAKAELLKIIGVGGKVADCVLLFGFHELQAFPKDVWIKRVLAQYYPDGLPMCMQGYEGIAQQFLFHYIRNLK